MYHFITVCYILDAKAHWKTLRLQLPVLPAKETTNPSRKKDSKKNTASSPVIVRSPIKVSTVSDPNHKDNSLRQFRKICFSLSSESSYLKKTSILEEFFKKGTDGGKKEHEYLSML